MTVANGKFPALQHIYMLRDIATTTRQVEYIKILKYLVKEKIVGDDFIEYVKREGYLNFISEMRMKMYSDWKKRKLYAKQQIGG